MNFSTRRCDLEISIYEPRSVTRPLSDVDPRKYPSARAARRLEARRGVLSAQNFDHAEAGNHH
jgi:hypothetical protein